MKGTIDDQLLKTFVESFGKADKNGVSDWRPRVVKTDRTALDALYRRLPARFPALYESLILNYRWAEVDLGRFRLLSNPPGPGLEGLANEMFRDSALTAILLPAGLVPFGKGPDVNYDPVCFKVAGTTPDRAPVVRVDHEDLLCHRKLVIVEELARDCRRLIEDVVERNH